ncbi:MAG: hypothetical protein IT371_11020 [Deltaproteobacteria bacterium]|nr:hypothetical protein [Deltaproteobacteria bacterium]
MKQFIRLLLVLFGSAAVGRSAPLHAAPPVRLSYKIVRTLSTIYDRSAKNPIDWKINSPDGIAWDGQALWVSACDSPVFSRVDPITGKVLKEIALGSGTFIDHLDWDGRYLWGAVHSMPGHVGTPDGRLIQVDPQLGKIVKTIEVPFRDAETMSPMGLSWDGTYLWSTDVKDRAIYRVDPRTGAGKDVPIFKTPSINGTQIVPCGVTWNHHGCLWISDLSLGAFFLVEPVTGSLIAYFEPPDNPEPTKFGTFRPASVTKLFTGMATDGKRTWILDELEGNPLIYEVAVDLPNSGVCAARPEPPSAGDGAPPVDAAPRGDAGIQDGRSGAIPPPAAPLSDAGTRGGCRLAAGAEFDRFGAGAALAGLALLLLRRRRKGDR